MRKLALLALVLSLTACSFATYDPVTVENIAAIQANASACDQALAYEQGKAHPDAKTIAHLTDLCSCYQRATNPIQKRACDAKVPAAKVYEANKGTAR